MKKTELLVRHQDVSITFLNALGLNNPVVKDVRDEVIDLTIKGGVLLRKRWTRQQASVAKGSLIVFYKQMRELANKAKEQHGVDIVDVQAKVTDTIEYIRRTK